MASAPASYSLHSLPADGDAAASVRKLLQARADGSPMPVLVVATKEEGSSALAAYLEEEIRSRGSAAYTLGLATGSTPIGLYEELARRHSAGLSLAHVRSYNLDEYLPIEPTDGNSYRYFMRHHLFSKVDVPEEAQHIPDGTVALADAEAHCQAYEEELRASSIDLQVLGIGRDGHIGFNEPGSQQDSRTRVVDLHEQTIADAAEAFGGREHVPKQAITMGVGSILSAQQCVLMAWGGKKAPVIARALASLAAPSADLPASFLATHARCLFIVDKAAAAALSA